jgi:hypothetical protein
MSELLYRFSLDAVKLNKQALICAIGIWVLVLGCAISSIVSQPFSKKQRTFWFLVICGVPFLGVLSYLPFSIRREHYPGLFNIKKKK